MPSDRALRALNQAGLDARAIPGLEIREHTTGVHLSTPTGLAALTLDVPLARVTGARYLPTGDDELWLHDDPGSPDIEAVAVPPALLRESGATLVALNRSHQARAPSGWAVKPTAIELEISTRCNLRCSACAILDDVERGHEGPSADEIIARLKESAALGIYAYAITGGEPFLALDRVLDVIKGAPGEVELYKIQTNATRFKSPAGARSILNRLIDAGYLKGRRLRPALHVSLGIQQLAGASLDSVCHLIGAHRELIGRRGRIVLNPTVEREEESDAIYDALDARMLALYGERFPFRAIARFGLFTLHHTPRAPKGTMTTVGARIDALPEGFRCFNFDEEMPSPAPRVLLRADRTFYPCSCFGFGGKQSADQPMATLLERANDEHGLRVVAERGLAALRDELAASAPARLQRQVPADATICKVCKAMREPGLPLYEEFRSGEPLVG